MITEKEVADMKYRTNDYEDFDYIEYKGVEGTWGEDYKKGRFFGQLLYIDGYVTYEGYNLAQFLDNFHDAVDEYLKSQENKSDK